MHQIIKEPTHILENSSWSCIDLVFISPTNLIVDWGTHPLLHPNCHHIIYVKFNLKIHYPPPYTCEVWHYKDLYDDLIRKAINQFNWERTFENKSVDKVLTFNKTILKRNALALKNKKVLGIFGKTFILALLSSVFFHVQKRVSDFF